MELILLVLIAGLLGYWLSRSRFSQSIDQTTGKVSESSRQAAEKAGGWLRGLFGRKKPSQDVVDAEFEEVETKDAALEESEAEPIKSAEKTTSRRKREEDSGQA